MPVIDICQNLGCRVNTEKCVIKCMWPQCRNQVWELSSCLPKTGTVNIQLTEKHKTERSISLFRTMVSIPAVWSPSSGFPVICLSCYMSFQLGDYLARREKTEKNPLLFFLCSLPQHCYIVLLLKVHRCEVRLYLLWTWKFLIISTGWLLSVPLYCKHNPFSLFA